jgi:hypothetical protein
MNGKWAGFLGVAGLGTCLALASNAGCGRDNGETGFSTSSSDGGSSSDGTGSSGNNPMSGDSGGSCLTCGDGGSDSGIIVCPQGLQCNVPCNNLGTTTISGKVYDPAKKNPLYNVAVYVPQTPLEALPKGVPTGADACSCAALFKSGGVVSTTTGVDGSFKLTNAPVGNAVPLVLQVGKWRKLVTIPVTACQDNAQADKTLALPGTIPAGDTNDNMPDIAVSTGLADTLECLMTRMGLPTSEYVAGAGGTGHVHVFSGGQPGPITSINYLMGKAEEPPMTGAPASYTALWDSQADLMPYDVTLLSCEDGETYNANPTVLEDYLNAGGRVFASHYHYAWFTNPTESGQSYMPPPDWGNNLASWTVGSNSSPTMTANGNIVQTLNGSTNPFVKGEALFQWLQLNGAISPGAIALPINPVRYNAMLGPSNKPSQSWINDDTRGNALYFSFDTPVNAMPQPDGGPPNYCGRAVFSDLHVGGEAMQADTNPPPGGCMQADLSPQEKALEFMLFDLSSCVIPDTVPPPDAGPLQ